jgi:hypothetical protein
LELRLTPIALLVELEVSGALKEAQQKSIAPLVITAPLKLPPSIKNSVVLQANGPQLVLPILLLAAQLVLLVNGAEKVLIPKLLIRTDARLLTINAKQDLPDPPLVHLEISLTLHQLEMFVPHALPVSTAQE